MRVFIALGFISLCGGIPSIVQPESYQRLTSGREFVKNVWASTMCVDLYLGVSQNMGAVKEISRIPDDMAIVNVNLNDRRTILSSQGVGHINCYPEGMPSKNTCQARSDHAQDTYQGIPFSYVTADIFVKLHTSPVERNFPKLTIQYMDTKGWDGEPGNVLGLAPESIFLKYLRKLDSNNDPRFLLSGSIKLYTSVTATPIVTFYPKIHPNWVQLEIPTSPTNPGQWGVHGDVSVPEWKLDLKNQLFCFSSHRKEILLLPSLERPQLCVALVERLCRSRPVCERKEADWGALPDVHLKIEGKLDLTIPPTAYFPEGIISVNTCRIEVETHPIDCPAGSVVLPWGFFDVQRVLFTSSETKPSTITFLSYFYIPSNIGLFAAMGTLLLAVLLYLQANRTTRKNQSLTFNARSLLLGSALLVDWSLVFILFYYGGQLVALEKRVAAISFSGYILIASTIRLRCAGEWASWLAKSLALCTYFLPCFLLPSESWIERTTTRVGDRVVNVRDEVADNSGTQCVCLLIGLFCAFWSIVIGLMVFSVLELTVLTSDFRKSMLPRLLSDREETESDFWLFCSIFSVLKLVGYFGVLVFCFIKVLTEHPEVWELERMRTLVVGAIFAVHLFFYALLLKRGLKGRKEPAKVGGNEDPLTAII